MIKIHIGTISKNIKHLEHANFSVDYVPKNHILSKEDLFEEDETFIFGLFGLVLNRFSEPKSKWFLNLYAKKGAELPAVIKGDYFGFIYNKLEQKLYIFNSTNESSNWYYCSKNNDFYWSDSFYSLINITKEKQININMCYSLLSYGHMLENQTLITSIFKLKACEFGVCNQDKMKIDSFFDYNSIVPNQTNKTDIFDKLTSEFNSNLELALKKDTVIQKKHLSTLSGGLDSRMTTLTIHNLNKDVDTFCFSQEDYLDHKIAFKIAQDFNMPFHFVGLENGTYVKNIENSVDAIEGLQIYTSIGHLKFALQKINLKPYGLLHSGQFGDGLLGGLLSNGDYFNKCISTDFKEKSDWENTVKSEYRNEEIFKIYNRVFNFTNGGSKVVRTFGTFYSSPFMDFDFMKTSLSIEHSLKQNQHIYLEWIANNYQYMQRHIWENTEQIPSVNHSVLKKRIIKKMKHILYPYMNKGHLLSMTPYAYWNKNNPTIIATFNMFFNKYLDVLDFNLELKNDVKSLFKKGSLIEKSLCLSLITIIHKICKL